MNTLLQDLRYGARMLAKRPGFTLIAVMTLALGIGATTAIFTVVNAVLLRPLPYAEPDRIMALWPDRPGSSFSGVSESKFVFWREQSQSFEGVAATAGIGSGVNLSGGNEPEVVSGVRVSADFFRVLGVHPAIGRDFTQQEDSPSGDRVVILTDSLWRRRFGGDPSLADKTVSINAKDYTVVGVMPPGFRYGEQVELLVPMRTNPASREEGHNYTVLARIKPGVSQAQAVADMKVVFDRFKDAYPKMLWRQEEGIRVEPYLASLTADSRPLLLIMLGAVGFVLLIACANVANLQLTQAASRASEMAVRQALGASWWRIARQLLTEGVLLAVVGGLGGLLLASWGTEALAAFLPADLIPRSGEISFDWRVLTFALSAAVLTGLIFALAPAVKAARVDVNHALKQGGGKGAIGDDRGRMRSALVVSEIALALVLLIGAGLLIRTFVSLRRVDPGFDPRNVLTFEVAPNGLQYNTTAKHVDYSTRALERIKALPGVEAAAVTSNLPLGRWLNLTVEVDGRPNSERSTEIRMITPEYFEVLRMRLLQGRRFDENDTAGSEPVVIVNEAYANRVLKDTDPLGQRLIVQRTPKTTRSYQVVGVVSDLKQFGLNSPAPAAVFVPLAQVPDDVLLIARQFVTIKFAIRTAVDPLTLASTVKREMLNVDSLLPVTNIQSLDQIVSLSLARDRFNTALLGLFAGIGLVLAVIGIYGVVAYSVMQRTREIGIRVALGARSGDVLKLVVAQGMLPALIGVVIGLGGAFALTRLLSTFLFGVTPTDTITYVATALLLTAVALGACFVPARKATRVDPMVALRYE
ncbi:MAG TPA: ABC transporter permease [Blastocatellia bacterium]|nr:ABC transporter permease [Blastocatellia bacterium]